MINPMMTNDTVMYPPLISMYFQERRSNSAMVAMESATQPKPTKKPAVAPQEAVVLGSARNAARFAAMITEKTRDRPNVLAILRWAKSASERLLADIQARPNRALEYQSPPRAKLDTAAVSTASQLICGMQSFSSQKSRTRNHNQRHDESA